MGYEKVALVHRAGLGTVLLNHANGARNRKNHRVWRVPQGTNVSSRKARRHEEAEPLKPTAAVMSGAGLPRPGASACDVALTSNGTAHAKPPPHPEQFQTSLT